MSKKEHPHKEHTEAELPQSSAAEETLAETSEEGLIEALLREKQELKDAYLRLSADMDNYRKRIQKEKEDYHKYAVRSLVEKLLPVLDNLERCIRAEGSDGEAIKKGAQIVFGQFEGALAEAGLSKIETQGGSEFDPREAEALMMEDNPEAEFALTIAEVFENGWRIGDYVLRTAKVKVYKKS